MQTYETVFGDEPAQKGVNYWMYDSERKGFGIVFFSNNGPYSDAGNRCYGEVADDRLAMVGPARFQYELDQEGKIKRTPTARSPSRGGYVTKTAAGSRG